MIILVVIFGFTGIGLVCWVEASEQAKEEKMGEFEKRHSFNKEKDR